MEYRPEEARKRLHFEPYGQRVRVRLGGELIADSSDVLELREGTYPPVLYFPRRDLVWQRFERTESSTACPFKGAASYFAVAGAEVAWSYEDPIEPAEALRERVAFYRDRVDAIELG